MRTFSCVLAVLIWLAMSPVDEVGVQLAAVQALDLGVCHDCVEIYREQCNDASSLR
jgi:hypothetical protein